jgi:hypothetical protein
MTSLRKLHVLLRRFVFLSVILLSLATVNANAQSPSFFYVATAVDANGFESAFSNEVNVIFLQGKHIAVLTWTAAVVPVGGAAVAGYKIYRGTVKGGPYTLISTALVTGVTYSDTFVPPTAPSGLAATQQ